MFLKNEQISLRPLEPEDLEFLYKIENDVEFWEVSGTQKPFAKHILKEYLKNAYQDIYEAKQLRLVIANNIDERLLGLIDLFDFEPACQRAGLGIVILKEQQNKGYAKQAVELMLHYCFKILNLNQIYIDVPKNNLPSLKLFSDVGFVSSGTKKAWLLQNNNFIDVVFLQYFKHDYEKP